jgi:hypothetical protein
MLTLKIRSNISIFKHIFLLLIRDIGYNFKNLREENLTDSGFTIIYNSG